MTDARAQQLREAIKTLRDQRVYPSYHKIHALVGGKYPTFCHDIRELYTQEPTLCTPPPYEQAIRKTTTTTQNTEIQKDQNAKAPVKEVRLLTPEVLEPEHLGIPAHAAASPFQIPLVDRVIGREPEPTVDARILWSNLGVETLFALWIQRRIEEYSFIPGIDYTFFNFEKSTFGTGVRNTEYYLSLDMAKQLAMLEKTEIGKQVRLYFLQCEKDLRQLLSMEARKREFLLPDYDPWTKQFPDEFWIQISRVYGFRRPRGSRHARGCRSITEKYIYGILPTDVHKALFESNPYCPNGQTRVFRHHQLLTDKGKEQFLHQRIEQVIAILKSCRTRDRDDFKRRMTQHDHEAGLIIHLTPTVRYQLTSGPTDQLWLFEASA